ncbi:TRAP transporter permease [Hippea jasoniae]|uniref:TRAP transporter permease n=1 Tax=Hippea jasoniae TaxID=944479 RepID=UPI00055502FD|nr:TRAP transporter permease [Hippea jasoniae]
MDETKKKKIEELLKEDTGNVRDLRPKEELLVMIIGVSWAIFQLLIASVWTLDSTFARSIHLAFAMAMIFLSVPFFKKRSIKFLPWLSQREGIPLIDYILAAIGVAAALYITVAWTGISMRMGSPSLTDKIFGILLVIMVFEATRRAIGPALPMVGLLFTLYGFFGPYLPDILAYKGVTLDKYVSQLSLSTEGIFGIPLRVSTTIVYLFVLLGAMLDKAGAGKFFIDLAFAGLGRYKGGPAKSAVVASGLTGLVSGSSVANVVTTGTFTIPLMKKTGYPATKAGATEVAASINGQLMPPIMGAAAFIIAEYVNVPYIAVVKAAFIPALVAYITLFFVSHFEASKLGLKGLPKEQLPNAKEVLKNGFHYLIPIGWLVIELMVLRHSPAMSAFRTIILLIFTILYQELRKIKQEGRTLKDALFSSLKITADAFVSGSRNMVIVALACASAGVVVGLVATGIGSMITELVDTMAHGNIYLLLIITAMASLLLGMGLPTTANYIVMASLTAPVIVTIAQNYGFFVPLMAAHLFCFYFGIIADDTPPVGLAAYAAAALADADPIPTAVQGFIYDMRTAILPFMFVFNPDIILYHITSWPKIIMIFAMTLMGSLAFASALQGWLITRNKWYEIPFLLLASWILFYPGGILHTLHLEEGLKYYMYLLGLLVFGLVYLSQKLRIKPQQMATA